MICTEVLNGMVRSFRNLNMELGKDYTVITVSINPRETAALAASKKKKYLESLGRPGAAGGWHFLTGEETQIRRLADAVGFHYVYDEGTRQYAHPAGVIVLTPRGRSPGTSTAWTTPRRT